MKKFKAIFAFVLASMCLLAFSGCDDKESPGKTAETTEHIEITEAQNNGEFNIKDLHSFDLENGDEFSGAWQITAGAGSKLGNFVYMFDGKGSANLIVGTTGYCSEYSLDENAKTFTCQLMFGINGSYTYKKSSDDEIVLTNNNSKETTTLSRLASFDIIPIPEQDAVIDDKLIGVWKSDSGEFYYFDNGGIMYQNQYGTMYTFYKYSAKDGIITAVSNMGEEEDQTDTLKYSISDDILTIDGYEYTKASTDELI